MRVQKMEFHKIQTILQEKLDRKRYEHTLGVLYTSAALCMQHEIDIEQGMLAGLLHDCGKAFKNKEQYMLCQQYHISLTEVEKENHALIHAKLGAYLAKECYGVTDDNILSAILYHTTGRPNMTQLEKIVYIADYIEPHRNLPMVEELRTKAFQDLDETLYQLLEHSLEHLANSHKLIDEMTIAAYQYYKKQRNK